MIRIREIPVKITDKEIEEALRNRVNVLHILRKNDENEFRNDVYVVYSCQSPENNPSKSKKIVLSLNLCFFH